MPKGDITSVIFDKTTLWLVTWIALNIILTITNKNFYQFMNFPFPGAVSLVHMLCSSAMSYITILITGTKMKKISYSEQFTLFLLSLFFFVNILMGNICLKYTSVVLVQVTRALVPGITLVLSVYIVNATYTKNQVYSIVFIIFGLGLTSFGDITITLFGFLLNMLGCLAAALKGVLTSKFLKGYDPMDLLFRLSSFSVIHLTLLLIFNGEAGKVVTWWGENGSTSTAFVFIANGFIAFFLNVCNVNTIKLTSALTISIAGNVKNVLTVGFGIFVFGDYIAPENGAGVFLTFVGVGAYTWACHQKRLESERVAALESRKEQYNNNQPLLPTHNRIQVHQT